MDLSGKIIYLELVATNSEKHQINTNSLNLGSYILEVIGEEQKDILYQWHIQDITTEQEIERTLHIAEYQNDILE